MTAHDDVLDERGVLQVDASRLKNTYVSPHLEAPITEGGNVLWCGTFQLAWNELRTLIGEDLHFAGKEPEMVAVLNKRQFLESDLDDASYVAVADFVRNDVHGRIQRELQRKFGGQASRKLLPSPADTPRPQDIVAYSYLFKNLEFSVVFERIEQPLRFGASRVACFGIGEVFKPGQAAMYGQVRVLDFRSPDDFIVELRTKSEGDRVILAQHAAGKDARRDDRGGSGPRAAWETVAGVPGRRPQSAEVQLRYHPQLSRVARGKARRRKPGRGEGSAGRCRGTKHPIPDGREGSEAAIGITRKFRVRGRSPAAPETRHGVRQAVPDHIAAFGRQDALFCPVGRQRGPLAACGRELSDGRNGKRVGPRPARRAAGIA